MAVKHKLCDHTLLTAEQEKELGAKAIKGDQVAIDTLVLHNVKLVAHIASHFVTSRITLGDAISIGTIGLISAAKRFDPERNLRFSTYATWWIRESLLEAYWEQKSGMIHVPVSIAGLERRANRGEELTPNEEERKGKAENARTAYANVYTLSPEQEPQASEDKNSPDEELIALMLQKLDKLLPYDAYILKARFGLAPFTKRMLLHEIGEVEGISRERVRQIEQRAMERLRALILEKS